MKAIVTVKINRPSIRHDPHNKKVGKCPIGNRVCTDVTGSHHSYIETGKDRLDIQRKAKQKWRHITRIEFIEGVEPL